MTNDYKVRLTHLLTSAFAEAPQISHFLSSLLSRDSSHVSDQGFELRRTSGAGYTEDRQNGSKFIIPTKKSNGKCCQTFTIENIENIW